MDSTADSNGVTERSRDGCGEGGADSGGNSPRLELSGAAAAALQQFYADQEQQAERDPFSANFGLSQFWYTEETAAAVAEEAVRLAGGGAIACIACPSLFRHLQQHHPSARIHLFEYDPRFEVLGHFTLYDYNEPLAVPQELHGAFAVVVADPPYLARECLEKTAQTMQLLAGRSGGDGADTRGDGGSTRVNGDDHGGKLNSGSGGRGSARSGSAGGDGSGGGGSAGCARSAGHRGAEAPLLLLTGATMRGAAWELLHLRPAAFRPQHSHKLGNEFYLYSSVEPSAKIGGWDKEFLDSPMC